MIQQMLAIWSLIPLPFLNPAWTFHVLFMYSVHVLLKPGLENFQHYFASMWDECDCVVVWSFFGIAFLWDWNENWPAYRYLKRQVRWSGIPISFRIFRISEFVVIHTVKGFGIVNKSEVDVFLELSCSFHDPADVGNLIFGSSAFSKSILNIWKFTVHILLRPGLENFEHYFTSMWDEYNCVVVWAFFGIAFLWDWNENWPFLVLWPLLSFPNLLAYWVQHFHSIIF